MKKIILCLVMVISLVTITACNFSEKKQLENGVMIDGYKLHKCYIDIFQNENSFAKLQIKIFEGRNREIRKMFESIGKKVVFLKRIKIEELALGNLKRGEFRVLTQSEIKYLKSL